MAKPNLLIKLAFITGLREVVLTEIRQYSNLRVIKKDAPDFIYIDFVKDIAEIMRLRSVSRAYLVIQDRKYNPAYISSHKSIIGNLVEQAVKGREKGFKDFKLSCAGSNSPEARSLIEYVERTYRLKEKEDSNMTIHIVKNDGIWEVGVQITPKPLSLRNYRVKSMGGAMNPTIAYAMNSLCKLEDASSYLNVFSGSATLLIEAAQCFPSLEELCDGVPVARNTPRIFRANRP